MDTEMVFEFGFIWAFAFLPLPILINWLMPSLKKHNSGLISPTYLTLSKIPGFIPRRNVWISKRNLLQWIILFGIWTLFIGAIASPQFVGKPELKVKTARSFLVIADISFSMAKKDWIESGKRMSRWEGVKNVMSNFIQQRESDQIGLIFFGSNPYLQAPLTPDLDVIQWMLDETDVGMAGQTTAIGSAIGMGIDILKDDTLDQKVILLLTDGVESGSEISPLDAATLAMSDSITIYTIGIGDPNASGSDLDENTLIQISDITAGKYFRAMDNAQLEDAYKTLNELEPIEFEEEQYKPTELLYFYPLGIGVILALFYQMCIGIYNLIKPELEKKRAMN